MVLENRDRLKIVFTISCFAVISIALATKFRRNRKQKQNDSSCYLKTESKPQQRFKRVLADNSYTPFKHLGNIPNSHPYESEIKALMENPKIELDFGSGIKDMEMRDSYVWIDSESMLEELVEVLSKERVFAVDTEHHSLRSFLGFTALIQVSTETEDYLVDAIALHDVMGILSPVFANAGICKVFHGADNDVLWLQRDFHIYVVNLYDTAKACDVLSKPQRSLAYLLETYCGVVTNKLLQREDWRQRPLPAEMVQYARMDAHYLLHIAGCLFAELKDKENDISESENSLSLDDKFHFVLEASRRSNAISLQCFGKEIEASPGESAASSILSRRMNEQGISASNSSDSKFQDLVRRLCCWRDLMARVHDESLRYVLSDYEVAALAEKVPITKADIYATITQVNHDVDSLGPNSFLQSPSSVVSCHFDDLNYIFQDDIAAEDLFQLILKKHLGPNGSCPLSLHNYALLSKNNLKGTKSLVSENGFKVSKKGTRKASRELFVQKFSCKSPVYHNCRIYASDGRLLCYCDRRKLEWYLRRDLAKLVDDNPPAIMLLFEPKGRPEDEGNDFYIQSKKNICVGCGEGNHYLRYRIIPSCYRMHFPEHMKSHRSHDIVLVCVDCHETAHSASERYKRQVAAEFGIPLFIHKVVDSSQTQDITGSSTPIVNLEDAGVSPLELRTAAMALLRHGPKMPLKRRDELIQIVMKYYGGRDISEEDLEKALLVGMCPHERRRFEKKKGLSLKSSANAIYSNKNLENNHGSAPSSIVENELNSEVEDVLHSCNDGQMAIEDRIVMVTLESDTSRPTLSSHFGVCEEVSVTNKSMNSDKSDVSDYKCLSGFGFDANPESTDSPTQFHSSVRPSSDGGISSNHNPKLSLLGHGPHGKQVVDYLLKEYGEDGIREFCQRWRRVFVEAIRPRFLPAGWDVTHSGRREYGEFSVYNPANKAPAAEKV